MCNINLAMNKRGIITPLISAYMNVASFNSFQSNSHGDGFFGFRNKHIEHYKSLNKLIFHKSYRLLATHQRLATHGQKTKENAHPFITKDFYLMHNGIFAGIGSTMKSDSLEYAEMLQVEYEKTKDVVQAIKNMVSSVSGYYSVLIYHRGTGKVYYYKNERASMSMITDKDWLILSTNAENVRYAKRFFRMKDAEVMDVANYVLFDVTSGMTRVAELPHPEPQPRQTLFSYDEFRYKPVNRDDDWSFND